MGVRKKNEKVGWDRVGVTRWPPGNMLFPWVYVTRIQHYPDASGHPVASGYPASPYGNISLFSFIPGVWVEPGPFCFLFWFRRFFYLASLLLFSLLLYRCTVEKGPRERLGDALWQCLWQFPMAKWTLELGSVHRYG